MPVDAVEMPAVLHRIEAAAAQAALFLISTPNLNFLANCQFDQVFRESVLLSDLCPPDGMPIVWIARCMGIPIKARLAGSDIFEALKGAHHSARLKVFLFGGAEGVAAAACAALDAEPGGVVCAGFLCPGFGSIDEMSSNDIIDQINSSNADFLIVSLGAKKGQLWLLRNHRRLRIPVRAHLGAALNFQAGTVKRAPLAFRKLGLEWLWRIKEEPYLWRRYGRDGVTLIRLLLTRVLPLLILTGWLQLTLNRKGQDLSISWAEDDETITLTFSGPATGRHSPKAGSCLADALRGNKMLVINLTHTCLVDARFLGLLLMLRKRLKEEGKSLRLVGASSRLKKLFYLNGAGFLLSV
jgi:N-acetylglucosaminyldiphosphoundecaprenol N-acetyl-beta-D-mannosaminyltransferase